MSAWSTEIIPEPSIEPMRVSLSARMSSKGSSPSEIRRPGLRTVPPSIRFRLGTFMATSHYSKLPALALCATHAQTTIRQRRPRAAHHNPFPQQRRRIAGCGSALPAPRGAARCTRHQTNPSAIREHPAALIWWRSSALSPRRRAKQVQRVIGHRPASVALSNGGPIDAESRHEAPPCHEARLVDRNSSSVPPRLGWAPRLPALGEGVPSWPVRRPSCWRGPAGGRTVRISTRLAAAE